VAENIGRETVIYVSNICQYSIAYHLMRSRYIESQELMKQLSQEGKR
jgi:hypothetical protein